MNKKERQSFVADIIKSNTVRTQDDLAKMLADKGIVATQATLSRDMKELGVTKVSDGKNGICYKLPSPQVAARRSEVTSVEVSGQLCVVKTRPGFASYTASMLDETPMEGVMGTIAGDDTVLVIMKENADGREIEHAIKAMFNVSEIIVRPAVAEDTVYAEEICREIYISSQERKTGIANRTPEYVSEKILAGKAVVAVTTDGEFAGFSYIESWGGKSFVATSGLIVAHRFRGLGIARKIKEQTFLLSRKLFPQAKIFSITTGAAVMKMNYELGYRPVPYSELTDDPEFWKGCEGCRHFDILKSHDYKMCICTGLLYDPQEHLEIKQPEK